jgi:hypothetical protein
MDARATAAIYFAASFLKRVATLWNCLSPLKSHSTRSRCRCGYGALAEAFAGAAAINVCVDRSPLLAAFGLATGYLAGFLARMALRGWVRSGLG